MCKKYDTKTMFYCEKRNFKKLHNNPKFCKSVNYV